MWSEHAMKGSLIGSTEHRDCCLGCASACHRQYVDHTILL